MMNNDFSKYEVIKKNYDSNINKLDEDLKNNNITEEEYQKKLKEYKNNYKSALGPLFGDAKKYIASKFEYNLDIYTTYKGYNVQMKECDIPAIMNNEEFKEVAKIIQYKIKNGDFAPEELNNLNNMYNLICSYHLLLLEDAPIRNDAPPETKKESKIVKEDNKSKEKIKVSFFIHYLPLISFGILLLIAIIIYLIYYYS